MKKSQPHVVEHLTYNQVNIQFDYTIIRKPRMKNIYIRIKEARVIVTANHKVSDKYLQDFVHSKASWIVKQLALLDDGLDNDLSRKDATVPFLGEWPSVNIEIKKSTKKEFLDISGDEATFYLRQLPSNDKLKELRDDMYKKSCHACITPLIDKCASSMNLYPSNTTYRKTKSRWGSCSSKDAISLNTRLMMLPIELIEYIIIHELSHIKHKNHSRDFWAHVEKYDMEYKKHRKALRAYEKLF